MMKFPIINRLFPSFKWKVAAVIIGGPYHGTRFQETGYEITLVPVALTVIIASRR